VALVSNPPPSVPEPTPTLDPDIVADDMALAGVVDSFIGQDPATKQWLEGIVVEQEALRQACEPDVWQLILHVDELCLARWADLTVALVQWAFAEGRRHPNAEPES
jgi:hypothetical protein